jgi:flagellar protein FlbD
VDASCLRGLNARVSVRLRGPSASLGLRRAAAAGPNTPHTFSVILPNPGVKKYLLPRLLRDDKSSEGTENPPAMITLTRINRSSLILNSDLIEHIQATPDTVITLTNGHNYLVLEQPDTVVERIIEYRRRCLSGAPTLPASER